MSSVRRLLGRKGPVVHTISRTETVYVAVERMAEHHMGSLVVVEDGAVVGIITERDYLRRVILRGRASKTTRVEEIMSAPVTCGSPADDIDACMTRMSEGRFRHLPIVEDGVLVGVLSMGDIVKLLVELKAEEIKHLEGYISGGY